MNNTDNTQKICNRLIERMLLPDSFQAVVHDIYLPLAEIIMGKKSSAPLLVSINGAQGSGKSTLTVFLKHIFASELGCPAAALSIDDFYLRRAERQQLSEQVHPLFITRGVPGTHDVNLIEHTLHALINRKPCRVPKFDKAADERCDDSDWLVYKQPVDVILFEGWCNNSPVQSSQELVAPVNELEASEDAEGVWRQHANAQLKNYHSRIFQYADLCIMLDVSKFERVYQWRYLQEQKLKAVVGHKQHVMNEKQLKRFIQHYERITRHSLALLPAAADMVLPVAQDHAITEIIKNNASFASG